MREEKQKQCIELYKKGMPILEIMEATRIHSAQTIYRILDNNNIQRRPVKTAFRKTITFDVETAGIIAKAHPRKLSPWVCETIKSAYRNGLVSTDE